MNREEALNWLLGEESLEAICAIKTEFKGNKKVEDFLNKFDDFGWTIYKNDLEIVDRDKEVEHLLELEKIIQKRLDLFAQGYRKN